MPMQRFYIYVRSDGASTEIIKNKKIKKIKKMERKGIVVRGGKETIQKSKLHPTFDHLTEFLTKYFFGISESTT